jgi:hypothetical protein
VAQTIMFLPAMPAQRLNELRVRYWPLARSYIKDSDIMRTEDIKDTSVRRRSFLNKQTPWPLVRKRIIPTEQPQLTRILVPTLLGRGVSRGQRGGSSTVVNLSFIDQADHL